MFVVRNHAARGKVRSIGGVWQEKSCRAATAPVENQFAGMFTRTALHGEALKPSLCHYSRDQRESGGVGWGGLSHRSDSALRAPLSLHGCKRTSHKKLCLRTQTFSWATQRAKFDLNPRTGGRSGFGRTQSESLSLHTVIKKCSQLYNVG